MIVFDASTLILLAKIGMLELFISNFHGEIVIPEEVRAEVCIKDTEEIPINCNPSEDTAS